MWRSEREDTTVEPRITEFLLELIQLMDMVEAEVGIEALGTDVEGTMMIISSRLSLNLASHTLEQVLSRRRKMLMDMCKGIELELRDVLDLKLSQFAVKLLSQAMNFGPLSNDTEWFNNDDNFAMAMSEVLFLQKAINAEAPRLLAMFEAAAVACAGCLLPCRLCA